MRAAWALADAVERAAAPDAVLVVLGGDCTITLGVLAGMQRVEPDTGLVYFDGDADLGRPGEGSGILDAMGIALHRPGQGDRLSSCRFPVNLSNSQGSEAGAAGTR